MENIQKNIKNFLGFFTLLRNVLYRICFVYGDQDIFYTPAAARRPKLSGIF